MYYLHDRIRQANKRVNQWYRNNNSTKKQQDKSSEKIVNKMLLNTIKNSKNINKTIKNNRYELRNVLRGIDRKIAEHSPDDILSTDSIADLKCVGLECMPQGVEEPIPYKLTTTYGRAWRSLMLSWIGYKITFNETGTYYGREDQRIRDRIKYAVLIQKFDTLLGLPVEEFPDLGLSKYGEKYSQYIEGERQGYDN